MRELLVVFARYPEIGKCKTRLIGALSAAEAAELHGQMVEHTLCWAKELESQRAGLEVQVHFHGGDAHLMSERFGRFDYRVQVDGDLGKKMRAACAAGVAEGFERIVVVGTDCPQLNCRTISRLLSLLRAVNVAVIPATDGGYVAIGLSANSGERMLPVLFENKDWGTEYVYRQTLDALQRFTDIKVALLPAHNDVDHPEDVEAGTKYLQGYKPLVPRLSVLIPVWRNENSVEECIRTARAHAEAPGEVLQRDVEIVVTVRGKWRDVADIALKHGVVVICGGATNRGQQLNQAVEASVGEYLCVLHADTDLPSGYPSIIDAELSSESNVAGAFSLSISQKGWRYRFVEVGVGFRSSWLRLPYGDQAIFLRRVTLHQVGGFDEIPIMEDYRLIKKLQRMGSIVIRQEKVNTSARRWEKLGVLKTTCINQLMIVGHWLGISPDRLASFYRREKQGSNERS